jgi:predicted MFS family arabinose efflux permease
MEKQISSNPLTKVQVLIMAIAAGVCVANVYYNQPILKDIASSFGASEGEAGSISVLTQVGYGFGLFFLIPLGDKINKKKLILCLLGAPFNFQSDTIGMYGFVAIAGALMAPVFGKLADRGNPQRSLTVAILMVIASLVIAKIAANSALA